MNQTDEQSVDSALLVTGDNTRIETNHYLKPNVLTEPVHHKHAKVILILLFILFIAVIGGLSYLLMQEKNNEIIPDNNTNSQPEETSVNQNYEAIPVQELDVPEGFVIYEGDGFEFYYPEDWGTVRVTSNDDDPIFSAEFTNKNDARLYLNSGTQDFTEGGRGGAKWDCVGHVEIGTKDIACKIVYIEDGSKKLSGSVLSNFEYVPYQSSLESVILHQYDFFEESIVEILFNPSSSYYFGGSLLIPNTNTADAETMRQIARLFTVTPRDGL